jgi:hypothetical protein
MLEIRADPNAESKQWSTWWEQRYINFSHQSTWNRWMRPKALGAIWIWKWNFVYLCFRNSFIVGNNLTFCLGCHWPRNKDQQEAAEGEEEQDEEGKQFRFLLSDFLFFLFGKGMWVGVQIQKEVISNLKSKNQRQNSQALTGKKKLTMS